MKALIAFVALFLIALIVSPLQAACLGGASTSFKVFGDVSHDAIFDLNQLEAFPPAQATITYFAAGAVVSESFTGVLLWDLLRSPAVGGIKTDPNIKNDILHKIIIVTGTDCYQSTFGAGEIDPFFGGSQILVAYASGGKSHDAQGFARVAVPGDKAGGRFVSNIDKIEVHHSH